MSTERREIRFRVWSSTLGKLFYQWGKLTFFGHETPNGGDSLVVIPHEDNVHPALNGRLFTDTDVLWDQFTGHKAKDGVDIFEGDIIRYGDRVGVVTWSVASWALVYGGTTCFFNSMIKFPTAMPEVLGNIHEHSHLLTAATP